MGASQEFPNRMTEKLEELVKCSSIDELPLNIPSRTYTYLLNDMGEEFKAKPIIMGLLSDDYEEESKKAFSYERTDVPYEMKDIETKDIEPSEKKKGFWSKLFGKNK